MIVIRRSEERGHAVHGWLDSHHTFSFADYYDPKHMGFRHLRVINEDRVKPGQGFGEHPHKDMEIVTYVLEGQLQHKDSMGNGSVISRGDIQVMSAGTGVRHSEFNASRQEEAHFLQIWILPDRKGLSPGYQQRSISDSEKKDSWRLFASPDGRAGSLTVHQDVLLSAGGISAGGSLPYILAPGRQAWGQVARGRLRVNGHDLAAGDGFSAAGESALEISALSAGEILLFDMS